MTDESGIGVATLTSIPATGSQTLAWTWSAGGARSEGGAIVLIYVKDANTADVYRDADADSRTGLTQPTVTIDSLTTDLVLGYGSSTATNPSLTATVFIDNTVVNTHRYDVSEVAAGNPSTTVTMTNGEYACCAAISLKEAAAGPGTGADSLTLPTSDLVQPVSVTVNIAESG